MTTSRSPTDYPAFLAALKERIVLARTRAIRAAFHEGVLLYWDIGRAILERPAGAMPSSNVWPLTCVPHFLINRGFRPTMSG
jgi:hypothetical protein